MNYNEASKPPCVYARTCNCASAANCLWLMERAGIEAAQEKGRTDEGAQIAKEIAKASVIRFLARHLADQYDTILDWIDKVCRHR